MNRDDHLSLYVAHVRPPTGEKGPNEKRWIWAAGPIGAAAHADVQWGKRVLLIQTCWQFWGTG